MTTLTVLPVIDVEHPASRIPRDVSEIVHCTAVFSNVKSLEKAVRNQQQNKNALDFVGRDISKDEKWFGKMMWGYLRM